MKQNQFNLRRAYAYIQTVNSVNGFSFTNIPLICDRKGKQKNCQTQTLRHFLGHTAPQQCQPERIFTLSCILDLFYCDRDEIRQTDKTDRTDRTEMTDRTDGTERTDRTDRTDSTEVRLGFLKVFSVPPTKSSMGPY